MSLPMVQTLENDYAEMKGISISSLVFYERQSSSVNIPLVKSDLIKRKPSHHMWYIDSEWIAVEFAVLNTTYCSLCNM